MEAKNKPRQKKRTRLDSALDELDQIFTQQTKAKAAKSLKLGLKVEGSKEDLFGKEKKGERKRTEEGYKIYSESELGLLKTSEATLLCPFDCDCCF